MSSRQYINIDIRLERPRGLVTQIDPLISDIASTPISVIRDKEGRLRSFYNVCKHRAHPCLAGEGKTSIIICPYHIWSYKLDGKLHRAPHTEHLKDFGKGKICLVQVLVEEFCVFVYVKLDPAAAPIKSQSGELDTEIRHWAPDIDKLTIGLRLTCDIKSNRNNVVDNVLDAITARLHTKPSVPSLT